jgi:hypothetical protein
MDDAVALSIDWACDLRRIDYGEQYARYPVHEVFLQQLPRARTRVQPPVG